MTNLMRYTKGSLGSSRMKLLFILLLVFGCNTTKHGCVDSQACNYDPDANLDNNSCIYEIDCAGECGGMAVIDCITNECTLTPDDVELWNNCYNIAETDSVNLSCTDGITSCDTLITIIPKAIGYLKNLKYLYLNNNAISSIPESIGNLENLEYFGIYHNNISYLPVEIGNLSSLKLFNIEGNDLVALPESIGNLENLEYFSLAGNPIIYLPESICHILHAIAFLYMTPHIQSPPCYAFGNSELCNNLPSCISSDTIFCWYEC